MRNTDVTVFGYAAVLDRLQVTRLPEYPEEGCVGTRQTPSLTADAVLVGLALARSGVTVDAVLSNPGSTVTATQAADLISSTVRQLRVGPLLGTPYELHINGADGRSMWFSDPRAGVNSLFAVDTSALVADWVYVDAFDWLAPKHIRKKVPLARAGLFVNAGRRSLESVADIVTFWSAVDVPRLAIQFSFGPMAPDLVVTFLSSLNVRAGVLLLATLGPNGLVLRNGRDFHHQQANALPDRNKECDFMGAGAAVSAALLRSLTETHNITLDQLAVDLTKAAAEQCAIDGALDRASRREWMKRLLSIGELCAPHPFEDNCVVHRDIMLTRTPVRGEIYDD